MTSTMFFTSTLDLFCTSCGRCVLSYDAQSLDTNVDASHPLIQQFFVELVASLERKRDAVRLNHALNYRQNLVPIKSSTGRNALSAEEYALHHPKSDIHTELGVGSENEFPTVS
jgi:hypothetical protein